MRLLEALRIQAAKIAADLDHSKLFTHMSDRGAFREEIIKDFLRPFLSGLRREDATARAKEDRRPSPIRVETGLGIKPFNPRRWQREQNSEGGV